MADLSGQQFGNYRLLQLLGHGGQASVYLGQHIHLSQKLAAVKLLHTHLSEEDLEHFRQEANTIVALSHPHIISILDFAVEQGTPFLVMDYYPDVLKVNSFCRCCVLKLPILLLLKASLKLLPSPRLCADGSCSLLLLDSSPHPSCPK